MVQCSIALDTRGVQKFKMEAYKPEVRISQLLGQIETQLLLHNRTKKAFCNNVIA